MADKSTYYECKYKLCDGGVTLCKPCAEWADKVDKAIENCRVDEAWNVTKTKRWANSRLNKINQRLNKPCFFA